MPGVSGRLPQQVAAGLAVFALVAFGLLPPEHLHVSGGHDGHSSEVVHRHFEPHHRAATQPNIDQGDDDHDVKWLTTSFTRPPPTPEISTAAQVVERIVTLPQPDLALRTTLWAQFASVHDPPWATGCGFRAPPASPSDLI